MKTLKRIFYILLSLCLALPLAACGGGSAPEVPYGVEMGNDYLLTWEEVEGARSYDVEIANVNNGEKTTDSTRRNNYSLADLEEGDYTVRIRSVSGRQNEEYSEWTEALSFHRDFESGILYSPINNNTEYEVLKVGSARGDVTVEDVYRGKPVTSIAEAAFRPAGGELTSVVIGKNVKTIGAGAFYNCTALTTVTMTDAVVSIGESVFQNCYALKSVVMSASLTSIPAYAFAQCTSLGSYTIGEAVVSIGKSAFSGCTVLQKISFPASVTTVQEYAFTENDLLSEAVFGENIKSIGEGVFYGCDNLSSVIFPEELAEGVTLNLGDGAFVGCKSLGQVTLPSGTENIGSSCFLNCEKLTEISIPESVHSVGVRAFDGSALYRSQEGGGMIYAGPWLLTLSDGDYETLEEIKSDSFREGTIGIAAQAFTRRQNDGTVVGCPKLWSIDLPDSVKYIGSYAFYNSPSLEQFATFLTDGLAVVGEGAFSQCAKLTSVRFARGLQEIGNYAFSGCAMLNQNSVDPRRLIPQSVTRVGQRAFEDAGLWIPDEYGVIYAGNWVVGYVGTGIQIRLHDELDGIADYAFYQEPEFGVNILGQPTVNGCRLQSIENAQAARNVGAGAFYYCLNLTAISLNINVPAIGNYTFAFCSALYRITIPANARSIGNFAFYCCASLREIDLSNSGIEQIGERAFYGCTALEKADFGTKLQNIGFRAFYGAAALKQLTIPGTVKEISDQAFCYCSHLTGLDLEDGVERIGDYAFFSNALFSIDIPDSVKEIGAYSFGYDSQNIYGIHIGSGVEKIGDYAFMANSYMGNVTIPANVKEIGDYAFYSSDFRSVIFRGNVSSLGNYVFGLCEHLTIYMEDGVDIQPGAWNGSFRPIVYGCIISDDGEFVSAVKTGNVQYATALRGISGPQRSMFNFTGWLAEDGTLYSAQDLAHLEAGQTLTAMYELGRG